MTRNPTRTPARIAVVGAGPGGLICARILQRHGIDVTVYDLDASATARDQGGSLDMHPDTGRHALCAAGLWDDFAVLARPEGEQWRLAGRDGRMTFDAAPPQGGQGNPEIDRGQLRALLLGSLAPGTVRWGHRLDHVEPLGDGRHRLHFAHAHATEADLVIGADGAWSRVRPLVSDAVPVYTGVTFVETGLNDADTRHPALAALTGAGTMMALDDNLGIVAQRNSGGHIRIYVGMRTPEDWHRRAGVDLADPRAVRDALLERFADWSPALRGFITDTDTGYVNRPLFALPVPHTWDRTDGVTLLGDAAHLMSPFSGMGANLAMRDGADLARALVDHAALDDAVTAYEKLLLPRSIEAAEGAADALGSAFAHDSAEQILTHMTTHH
ncbi:FAD-dependent monooxygenase [Streptomyces sp. KCTC 0041BP]|uniref:FAD-dependent oxidoreductase n=1 Tax=Streptomyces sp. KCTC 0041BP TaxID=201500 RepID=UPI001AE68F93|nr:NAD(P)/FAD-dependent oxidoreductase [Streptomyces sp. KCTC 0041BP]MBP0938203.1 FAD-dependent monooxygenase [Streptomyces sp. KCTC 0041BP]